MIPRKDTKGVTETAYEEPRRLIKTLVRELQDADN